MNKAADFRVIPVRLYDKLNALGVIPNDVRECNVGASDYSSHVIQPWAIWQEYQLNPWDADIVKRVPGVWTTRKSSTSVRNASGRLTSWKRRNRKWKESSTAS